MKLTFLYLDIQNADCDTDKIEIFTGPSSASPARTICKGNDMVDYELTTSALTQVLFTGKSVGTYRGFHASVTFF